MVTAPLCSVLSRYEELSHCLNLFGLLVPETKWFTNSRHLFLTVLEAGKSEMEVLADLISAESLLPGS